MKKINTVTISVFLLFAMTINLVFAANNIPKNWKVFSSDSLSLAYPKSKGYKINTNSGIVTIENKKGHLELRQLTSPSNELLDALETFGFEPETMTAVENARAAKQCDYPYKQQFILVPYLSKKTLEQPFLARLYFCNGDQKTQKELMAIMGTIKIAGAIYKE